MKITRITPCFAVAALLTGAPLAATDTLPSPPSANTQGSATAAKPKAPASGPNFTGRIAQQLEPSRSVIYKHVAGRDLRLDVFEPAAGSSNAPRACFIAIHGGGWISGAPRAMYPFSAWAAEQGMLAISVQYRLYQPNTENTVFHCVQDARSAVRYIREHAADFNIDPDRIVVCGSSAGGHLAVATALFDAVNEPGENTGTSCVPNALVLFSPVIDTSAEGYGQAKVGSRWRELSPAHRVRPGLPPTLLCHGTADATTPFKGAVDFDRAMRAAGNRCELVAVEGEQHTYMMKDAALYARTQEQTKAFLLSTGILIPVASPARQ